MAVFDIVCMHDISSGIYDTVSGFRTIQYYQKDIVCIDGRRNGSRNNVFQGFLRNQFFQFRGYGLENAVACSRHDVCITCDIQSFDKTNETLGKACQQEIQGKEFPPEEFIIESGELRVESGVEKTHSLF